MMDMQVCIQVQAVHIVDTGAAPSVINDKYCESIYQANESVPRNVDDALAGTHREQWMDAMMKESSADADPWSATSFMRSLVTVIYENPWWRTQF